MNALYLCYQSLLEPLTQTQVLPYLEGLTQAGYGVVLLSFEPRPLRASETDRWRRRLIARRITWCWRRYHKRPTVPSTAWDVVTGVITGLQLIRRYKVRLVHARCHVAAVMALALKRLTGAKLLFDVRGLLAEEYVDAGVWPPNGILFRLTKCLERVLIGAADGIVVLTEKAKELFRAWYPQETARKPLAVIPCCVDFRQRPPLSAENSPDSRDGGKILTYVGKLDGWYPTDAIAALMAAAVRTIPGVRWQVWTQSDPRRLRQLLAARAINGQVTVGAIAADALPEVLARAQAGLSFRKPGLSALAASPTKVGEYLAAGLPVIANADVGDTDALLLGRGADGSAPVGVLVRDFSEAAYREALPKLVSLLNDSATPQRCRAAARRHLDLEHVGWARYRQLYDALLGTK